MRYTQLMSRRDQAITVAKEKTHMTGRKSTWGYQGRYMRNWVTVYPDGGIYDVDPKQTADVPKFEVAKAK